jgi:predicted small secreted protein
VTVRRTRRRTAVVDASTSGADDGPDVVRCEAVAETLGGFVKPIGRENAMTRKLALLLAALAFGSISLTACNTIQGAGRDVERAGQKVQEEAVEHKKY